MKIKNNFFARVISLCLLLTLVVMSGVGAITVSAAAPIESNNVATLLTETSKDNSTFASKNLITNEETYYNLYSEGKMIDLSEEAEIAALNSSNVTSKSNSAYFPSFATATPAPTEEDTRSIIGTDSRTRVTNTTTYPYSAICHITISWPDGATSVGTAWMYWENVAITAGHCVYSADHGGWATSIAVRPGANESYSPYGTVYSTTIHTATKWIDEANWEYDYGVIELSSDIGNSTGWFGTSWTLWTLLGTDITVTGYPGEYTREMWQMSGEVTTSRPRKVYYDLDTTGGQSGSPVYKSDYHVIAIHAYGGTSENSGTRITSALFDFFASFREE